MLQRCNETADPFGNLSVSLSNSIWALTDLVKNQAYTEVRQHLRYVICFTHRYTAAENHHVGLIQVRCQAFFQQLTFIDKVIVRTSIKSLTLQHCDKGRAIGQTDLVVFDRLAGRHEFVAG